MTTARHAPINLNDPYFSNNEAHEVFRRLRHEDPLYWNEPGEISNGFWAVTKYETSFSSRAAPSFFISSKGIAGPGLRPDAIAEAGQGGLGAAAGAGNVSIITMDPPRHVKMRRLVNKGFTPRA